MKIRCKITLVLALLVFILCACDDPEPEVYAEETRFMFDAYILRMDEKGRFYVSDILGRSDGRTYGNYVLQGKYYLYESELVLTDMTGGIETTIVLTADGVKWVFDQKQSKGVENLKFSMEDQSVWRPLGIRKRTEQHDTSCKHIAD